MDKQSLIIILFLTIVLIVGIYSYISHESTINNHFDKNGGYISDWDDSTNEITVEQVFPQKYNETLENVTTEVTFYNGSFGVLDSVSVINDTYGGNLVVHAKAKLSEKPTHIEFDIHDADIIDDSESVISIL